MEEKERDISIIDSYKNGNEAAFEELVKIYSNKIYNFSKKFVQKEEAEDIVSETFLKVWRNINKYDSTKASFKSWIFTIANNNIIDFLRKKKNVNFSDIDFIYSMQDSKKEDVSFLETIPDENFLPEIQFEKFDNLMTFNNILEKLSDLDRDILLLHFQADMTFEEIGIILKIPLNTVKSRYRRALVYIKSIFAPK